MERFSTVLTCVRLIEFLNGRNSESEEERDPGLCSLRVDLRAVMFPLAYSQALMVEWIGSDLPED